MALRLRIIQQNMSYSIMMPDDLKIFIESEQVDIIVMHKPPSHDGWFDSRISPKLAVFSDRTGIAIFNNRLVWSLDSQLCNDYCMGIKIIGDLGELYLLSLYCCTDEDLKECMSQFRVILQRLEEKHIIICIDVNAVSIWWSNSDNSDSRGDKFEDFILNNSLCVLNRKLRPNEYNDGKIHSDLTLSTGNMVNRVLEWRATNKWVNSERRTIIIDVNLMSDYVQPYKDVLFNEYEDVANPEQSIDQKMDTDNNKDVKKKKKRKKKIGQAERIMNIHDESEESEESEENIDSQQTTSEIINKNENKETDETNVSKLKVSFNISDDEVFRKIRSIKLDYQRFVKKGILKNIGEIDEQTDEEKNIMNVEHSKEKTEGEKKYKSDESFIGDVFDEIDVVCCEDIENVILDTFNVSNDSPINVDRNTDDEQETNSPNTTINKYETDDEIRSSQEDISYVAKDNNDCNEQSNEEKFFKHEYNTLINDYANYVFDDDYTKIIKMNNDVEQSNKKKFNDDKNNTMVGSYGNYEFDDNARGSIDEESNNKKFDDNQNNKMIGIFGNYKLDDFALCSVIKKCKKENVDDNENEKMTENSGNNEFDDSLSPIHKVKKEKFDDNTNNAMIDDYSNYIFDDDNTITNNFEQSNKQTFNDIENNMIVDNYEFDNNKKNTAVEGNKENFDDNENKMIIDDDARNVIQSSKQKYGDIDDNIDDHNNADSAYSDIKQYSYQEFSSKENIVLVKTKRRRLSIDLGILSRINLQSKNLEIDKENDSIEFEEDVENNGNKGDEIHDITPDLIAIEDKPNGGSGVNQNTDEYLV